MSAEPSPTDESSAVRPFRVDLVMRYTRISCMPFRATYPASRIVQAQDEEDAVRQACLCLDRDLEEILSRVNAINVSEVRVQISDVEGVRDGTDAYWNPQWFSRDVVIPPYVVVR